MREHHDKHHADEPATKLKIIFRSLQYRNYRLFFGGQSISLIGTWIQRIATPWLVYRLSSSPFLLGVVGFAGQISTFLLAPFAGVLIDRWNRLRVLIVTQILAMTQALLLAVLFFAGALKIWHIIVLNVFLGCINAFDMPARQSLVVDMIEKKEDLGNAIALNSSMVNAARLLGPSIAGVLIAATGEGICFLINGLSYLFVIASLLKMKVTRRQVKIKNNKVLSELKEGFAYVFGFAPLRSIILLLALVSLVGMPYALLMPVFAREVLHGGPHTFGFLMGAAGTGALIGALYLASRRTVVRLGKIIPLSTAIFGSALIVFSFSRFFLLSLITMLVAGFGMMMQMASSNTILQTIVDDDKRGRVMSFYTMAFIGTAPFGSLLTAGLASKLGAPNTLIIGGLSCILGSAIFATRLSELKKLVHPIYVRQGIITNAISEINTDTKHSITPEG